MDNLFTSCHVTCHRCRHEWTYMGSRLASLLRSRKPVRVQCPRCQCRVIMEASNAV
ncbi:MAG TPA: hypothetical protein VMT44_00740 [Methanoregula sp.]|nr:hypothetical protein [Methanoregula sp.]